MTIALHGNLRDFGMGEVFQLIGQQRKTGVLQVRGSQGEVELRFDNGCVVSAAPVGAYEDQALGEMAVRCGALPRERLVAAERARSAAGEALRPHLLAAGLAAETLLEIEDLLTRETLFDLLRWDEGSFRFVSRSISHARPPDSLLGAEQVLMDGLRMVDEWRALAGELPAETTVFKRRGSIEDYRSSPAGRAAAHPAEAERLFLLIDGRSSARRVIDLSRLGTFLGMQILIELARAGWIEPVRGHARAGADAGVRGAGARLRRGLAVALPLAALVALAALPMLRAAPPAPLPGVALPEAPLAEARAAAATLRVRRLVQAETLARGGPPATLAAVRGWPDATGTALAPQEAAAYHVARRGGDLLVLAPER